MTNIPTFAFVGPVNPGKTSVIATLVENDDLNISSIPGETTRCQRFEVSIDGRHVLAFYDTPGFQNAKVVLAKLKELGVGTTDPLEAFRRFQARFGHDPYYAEESKLFEPILNGAGIVYVVDASRPVQSINEAEMDILRMTGLPRLGLINWTADPVHKQLWKNKLSVHFGLIREFNAHTATYRDRIELLNSLALIDPAWQPGLRKAVDTIEADWKERTHDAAKTIADLLADCLSHQESRNLTERADQKAEQKALVEQYRAKLRKLERSAHKEIVAIFKHNRVSVGESETAMLDQDLFSERTWQVLGLNRQQLAIAGATAGAAGGLLVEGVLLGHGLGIPTIVGTVLGAGGAAAGAFFGGEHLTKVKIPVSHKVRLLLGWKGDLGGVQLRVGPNEALNFPWILMDRALTIYYSVIHRAHARQDNTTIHPAELIPELRAHKALSAAWDDATRKTCDRCFALVRRNKARREDMETLVSEIERRLEEIGNAEECGATGS